MIIREDFLQIVTFVTYDLIGKGLTKLILDILNQFGIERHRFYNHRFYNYLQLFTIYLE